MIYSSFVLIISFVIKLVFIFIYHPTLWNDELILFNVSQQSIERVFDIMSAERHPPFYYFVAKLLPSDNADLARVILTVLGYGLVFWVIKWIEKKNIPNRREFDLGLAIFLCSNTFLIISSDLKRQALAFPLLLLSLAFTWVMANKRSIKTRELIIGNVFLLGVFLIDYTSYFWAILGFSFIAIYKKQRQLLVKTGIIQGLVFLVYFLLFGARQFFYNAQVVGWLEYLNSISNNPYTAFLQHLGGNFSLLSFVISILFLLLLGIWYLRLALRNRKLGFVLLLFISLCTAVTYLFHFFIRVRYSFFLFFLLSLGIGFGLVKLKMAKTHTFLILTSVFLLGWAGYVDFKLEINRAFTELENRITSEIHGEKIGFTSNGQSVFQYVFSNYYLKNDLVVPISAPSMAVFADKQWITKKEIASKREDNLSQKLADTVRSERISSIAYLYFEFGDRPDEFGGVIETACSKREEYEISDEVWLKWYKCT